jgi:RimJ/RimL family protein N-acetyltransferase
MSDSRVHTYASGNPWTLEHTANYIKFMLEKNFKTLELFHGACVLKSNNTIIGLTGLNPYLPKKPEIEWKFGVPFWGNGYATEIGKAIIKEAFKTTDIELIYGMAHPQNLASMKVMEKLGMTSIGLQDFRGNQDMFYQIKKEFI